MTESCTFSSCSSTRSVAAAVLPWLSGPQSKPGWNEPRDIRCNQTKPPPARRHTVSIRQLRQHGAVSRPWLTLQSFLYAVLVGVLFCCQGANAQPFYTSEFDLSTELLYDRSEPPAPRMRLQARQDASSSLPSSIAPTASEISGPTSTGNTGIVSATPLGETPLPKPFDTSLGNNFTSPSCPQFFNNFLANETFKECLPFSLLLQTSNSFFTTTRSLVRLTQTLDATCNVNFQQCSAVMADLAQQIQQPETCGSDLQMQNPMVIQAYNGFLAYQPLYHAGCLTDTGGNYCYANAVTNASAPTSSYIYYLPLGVQLPGGTRPACNMCLQDTMAIFATAASNSSQPISGNYGSAAQQVDMGCGPTFVEANVKTSSAGSISAPSAVGLLALFGLLMSMFV